MPSLSLKGAICEFSLLALLLTGCGRQPETTQAAAEVIASDNYFQTHFQEESQFIIETILTDLAEMAGFAQTGQRPAAISVASAERIDSQLRVPSYEVTITSGKQRIQRSFKVTGPIWAPEVYEDFARALLADSRPAAKRHDRNDLSLLVALTDLDASTIESENQRISGLLEANFNDPVLHEMAAALLGVFALRESSGQFYDVRLPLCRMTAHLALAKVLSGESSVGVNGKTAGVMLSSLMNNQKTTLEKLKALESETKLKPWVNALRARTTYDYRPLQGANHPTRLESVMFYYALSQCINRDAGWAELSSDLHNGSPDFVRMAFADDYSVSLGHTLHEISLPLELAEIEKVHSLILRNQPANKQARIEFLNQLPERCFLPNTNRVRIIGPGQWAAFLQRHLCHALQNNFTFLHHKWGVPEEAKAFALKAGKEFGKLRLHPFVRRINATTEEEYHRAVDDAIPVLVATPHLVSPYVWNFLGSPPRFAKIYWPHSHPHVNEWHKHNPPPGTVYDLRPRLFHPSLIRHPDVVAVLEQLHEMAPYEAALANALVERKYAGQATLLQAEEILRPLIAYSAYQNLHLAKYASDPVRYEEIMARYAKMNPAGYFTLGRYFADRQETGKAVAYYEKAINTGTDPITMANNCNWLVRYYFSKGERAKAEALADQAAAVYSSGGLTTKAELMEMEKKYDEALECYRQNEQRYNQSGPLVGFCVRYKAETGDSRFDKLVQARLRTLFPRGIEKVRVGDLKSAPGEGVLISQDNELLQQASLKKGDIIVALDGIRVYDMTQYQYVRDLTKAAEMRLIIWNGKEFMERKASPPKRRFGVPFLDFHQSTGQ